MIQKKLGNYIYNPTTKKFWSWTSENWTKKPNESLSKREIVKILEDCPNCVLKEVFVCWEE